VHRQLLCEQTPCVLQQSKHTASTSPANDIDHCVNIGNAHSTGLQKNLKLLLFYKHETENYIKPQEGAQPFQMPFQRLIWLS